MRGLSISTGRSCRLGTANPPGCRSLPAGVKGFCRRPRRAETAIFSWAHCRPGHAVWADVVRAASVGAFPSVRRPNVQPARAVGGDGAEWCGPGLQGLQGRLAPSGGRRQRERFGHGGFRGAQHRGDRSAGGEIALAGRAHDTGRHLLGVRPAPGAIAAADLARDHPRGGWPTRPGADLDRDRHPSGAGGTAPPMMLG